MLKTLLSQNPRDAFVRYGLAMEYVNAGELELAAAEFREVLKVDPNYAYAYYHGGQTLEKLGEMDAARQLYEDGITVTQRTGDSKARSELQAALDILPL